MSDIPDVAAKALVEAVVLRLRADWIQCEATHQQEWAIFLRKTIHACGILLVGWAGLLVVDLVAHRPASAVLDIILILFGFVVAYLLTRAKATRLATAAKLSTVAAELYAAADIIESQQPRKPAEGETDGP